MKCKDCGNTHPPLPGFPNHVLCDYYRLHMSNLADASRCEHYKPNVLTNADRIRAMTDAELDEFLGEVQWDVANYCGGVTQKQKFPVPEHRGAWLDWLKSPVEVDE